MYCDGCGFKIIGSFQNHGGYDGVMLGYEGCDYHLEFTTSNNLSGVMTNYAPDPDNLLVFYIATTSDWQQACDIMLVAGFKTVESKNPYWDRNGKTFIDIDGYRVVLQNQDWAL